MFAENRRKAQIGLRHLRSVTFSSALEELDKAASLEFPNAVVHRNTQMSTKSEGRERGFGSVVVGFRVLGESVPHWANRKRYNATKFQKAREGCGFSGILSGVPEQNSGKSRYREEQFEYQYWIPPKNSWWKNHRHEWICLLLQESYGPGGRKN